MSERNLFGFAQNTTIFNSAASTLEEIIEHREATASTLNKLAVLPTCGEVQVIDQNAIIPHRPDVVKHRSAAGHHDS